MKKTNPISKGLFTSKKSKSQLKVVIAVSVLAVGIFYLYMLKQNSLFKAQTVDINEVNVSSEVISTPRECETVRTISYNNLCGARNYSNITFSCGSTKKVYRLGDKSACKNVTQWYAEAISTCTSACPPQTPRQSISPRPSSITIPRSSGKIDLIYGTEPVKPGLE
ncbi:MAG: hypothetical protein WAV40_01295 [Microgenomates group bacterium]